MGRFSNGSDGLSWEEYWCRRCIHDDLNQGESGACPILLIHILYNYEQHEQTERGEALRQILSSFIPDEVPAGRCAMFVLKRGKK